MLAVKTNFFSFLDIPIWNSGFGQNKTWRGFVILPFLNAILLFFVNRFLELNVQNAFFLGAVLGLVYLLSELPNSFIKRRLGIKAGQNPKEYRFLMQLFDKLDSAVGVLLTYFLLGYTDWKTALLLLILASGTHMFVSYILVLFKIKKSF